VPPPPKYEGTFDSRITRAWVEHFTLFAEVALGNLSDSQKLKILKLYLTGKALLWYSSALSDLSFGRCGLGGGLGGFGQLLWIAGPAEGGASRPGRPQVLGVQLLHRELSGLDAGVEPAARGEAPPLTS
jgi:hypothetical protein